MSLRVKLQRLRNGQPEDISRFAASLPSELVDQALKVTGKASFRKRKLPASQAVWVVIGMALFSDRSIQRVIEHLELVVDGLIHSSAVTRARRKIGFSPLIWLFRRIAEAWGALGETRWNGLSLYGVDGSHLRVDDSEKNDKFFGRPKGRDVSGYPQLRMVGLMNLASRMLTGAAMGPWNIGEASLARQLWGSIPNDSLTIIDRGFLSFCILLQVLSTDSNRHFLIRLKKNSTFHVKRVLSDGSAIAHIKPTKTLRVQNPDLPLFISVRLISYCHPGGRHGLLMTSLVDHHAYPAEDIIEVYHKRWELEVGFDELKTDMLGKKEALRSKTPEGVEQEFWGIMLVYNLLRREMASVAQSKGLEPSRISFTGALLLVQNFFLSSLTASPGTLPKELAEMERSMGRSMVLPERRKNRRYPRQIKIKMSNYKKAPARHMDVC